MSHRIEVKDNDDQAFANQITRHEKIALRAAKNISSLMGKIYRQIVQFENTKTLAQQVKDIQQRTEKLVFNDIQKRSFDKSVSALSKELHALSELIKKLVEEPTQNEIYQKLLNEVIKQESILIRHKLLQRLSSLFSTERFLEGSPSWNLSVTPEHEQKITSEDDSDSFNKINRSLQKMKSSYRVLKKIEIFEMVLTSITSILGLIAPQFLWKDSSFEFGEEKTATSIAAFSITLCLCMLKCGNRRSLSSFLSSSIFCHRDKDAEQDISAALDEVLESVKELVDDSEEAVVAQVDNDAQRHTQRPSN